MTEPLSSPDERRPTSEDWGRLVGSQRDDQYTPMGEIHMVGDFVRGLHRRIGTRSWAIVALRVIVVGLVLLGVLAALW